jgi:nitroreductase
LSNTNQYTDVYQERYLIHQEKKLEAQGSLSKYTPVEKNAVLTALNNRKSCRLFTKKEIPPEILAKIRIAAQSSPSSCNRKGVYYKEITGSNEIKASSELLVGGSKWLQKATIVFLLFADMLAYKSPNEVDFMPYLDAGFMAENIYIACEALELGACFVNPNIREKDKERFNELFGKDNHRFCGAIAIGLRTT